MNSPERSSLISIDIQALSAKVQNESDTVMTFASSYWTGPNVTPRIRWKRWRRRHVFRSRRCATGCVPLQIRTHQVQSREARSLRRPRPVSPPLDPPLRSKLCSGITVNGKEISEPSVALFVRNGASPTAQIRSGGFCGPIAFESPESGVTHRISLP